MQKLLHHPGVILVNSLVFKFDKLLGSQFGVDYWSDEGIGIAVAIAFEFREGDWAQLAALIHQRSPLWRSRCAESLGDQVSEPAAELLLKLMRDDDREVAIAALDSLNSQAQLGLSLADSKDLIAEVLVRFPDHPESVASLMISRLRGHLGIC